MSFYATDEAVGRLGGSLVERSLAALGPRGLAADKLAVTLLVHDRPLRATPSPGQPRGFSYRGDQPFYPCRRADRLSFRHGSPPTSRRISSAAR